MVLSICSRVAFFAAQGSKRPSFVFMLLMAYTSTGMMTTTSRVMARLEATMALTSQLRPAGRW